MIVPVDLLEPILDSLLSTGRSGLPPRPWLGIYTTEIEHRLVIAGLAERGPGAQAGLQVGDMVIEGRRATRCPGLQASSAASGTSARPAPKCRSP
jgi:S1-C subfamily serine protease